jgi:hypothetical protein
VPASITGNGTLLRYDLSKLAPRTIAGVPDVLRMVRTWEKLAEDEPWFHTTQKISAGDQVAVVAVDTLKAMNGNTTVRTLKRGDKITISGERLHNGVVWLSTVGGGLVLASRVEVIVEEAQVFPLNPAGGQALVTLATATNSQSPIVHVGHFYSKVLQTLNGGMYYDFSFPKEFRTQVVLSSLVGREISDEEFKKMSDLDKYLMMHGADPTLVQAIRSDQKAAVFRSQVTGKIRAFNVFSGAGGRPEVNQGLITMTEDIGDDERDARKNPIRELLRARYTASEVIPERINGLHSFGLFTGNAPAGGLPQGLLQLAVPDDIARDHTVPPPHTARLQPPIGCYRCHNRPDASRGYIPFNNDVKTMLDATDLDVLGERSDGAPNQDTISRLAGLYSGTLDKPLRRARDDYSDAVLVATKGLPTTVAYTEIANVFGDYEYKLVTPEMACEELGFKVTEGKAVDVLRKLLPRLPPDELGIHPEDPVLGALKAGLGVNRLRWAQVYPDALYRSTTVLQEILTNEAAQND